MMAGMEQRGVEPTHEAIESRELRAGKGATDDRVLGAGSREQRAEVHQAERRRDERIAPGPLGRSDDDKTRGRPGQPQHAPVRTLGRRSPVPSPD